MTTALQRFSTLAALRQALSDRQLSATELVAALIVGVGLGWGIDWLFGHFGFHTRPAFLILFFVLGAAAGIRNVMRAATEINAEIAKPRSDKENGS